MINKIFSLCVDALVWLAELTGMTYQEVNVWIFCVIWPVFTLFLMVLVVVQFIKGKKMNKSIETNQTRCQECDCKIIYRMDIDPFPVYCDPCIEERRARLKESEEFAKFAEDCGSRHIGHCMRVNPHPACGVKSCPLYKEEKDK